MIGAPARIEGQYRLVAPVWINRDLGGYSWWYPGMGQLVRRSAQRAAKQSNAYIVPMGTETTDDGWEKDENPNQWMMIVDGKAPDAMINRHAVMWPVTVL